jgi:acyl-coenzyme A synthetase/AMP-(fatty) acid ligase
MTWIINHIDKLDNRNCIADSRGIYKYSDLYSQVCKYRSLINDKIDEGDIVGVLADYNFYVIALLLVLIEKKCILVPIVSNVKKESEERVEVASCGKTISISTDGNLSINKNLDRKNHQLSDQLINQKQAGLILFSSGSTGEPKAMIHNIDKLVNSYSGKKIKNINILIFLMFDHIGGLNTLFNSLAMGAFIIIPKNRKPAAIAALIERHKVHVLPASPTFLNIMMLDNVKDRFNLNSLRMVTYGTEPMPESLLVRLNKAFPKTRFMQTFGTSETGIIKTSSRSSGSLEMKFNDSSQEYKVIDGELWLKSETQVLGYLNAKMDSFTKDGWFRTGDLVEELSDGYIKIKGRLKEMINVGGEKVLPIEVESVLMEIPIIKDAVVRGEPNLITGQSVTSDIVLLDNLDYKKAKKEIRKYCFGKLSVYKVPTKINFVEKTSISGRFKKIRKV